MTVHKRFCLLAYMHSRPYVQMSKCRCLPVARDPADWMSTKEYFNFRLLVTIGRGMYAYMCRKLAISWISIFSKRTRWWVGWTGSQTNRHSSAPTHTHIGMQIQLSRAEALSEWWWWWWWWWRCWWLVVSCIQFATCHMPHATFHMTCRSNFRRGWSIQVRREKPYEDNYHGRRYRSREVNCCTYV